MAAFRRSFASYKGDQPFDHRAYDNFFLPDVATALRDEFPDFASPELHEYDNLAEKKRTLNDWNSMPPLTCRVFDTLNGSSFLRLLSE